MNFPGEVDLDLTNTEAFASAGGLYREGARLENTEWRNGLRPFTSSFDLTARVAECAKRPGRRGPPSTHLFCGMPGHSKPDEQLFLALLQGYIPGFGESARRGWRKI